MVIFYSCLFVVLFYFTCYRYSFSFIRYLEIIYIVQKRLVSPSGPLTFLGFWNSINGGGLVPKLCLTPVTLWTAAHQALLSLGFSRQKYWSGFPFPSPGDLMDPGIEPWSPAFCRWILCRVNH